MRPSRVTSLVRLTACPLRRYATSSDRRGCRTRARKPTERSRPRAPGPDITGFAGARVAPRSTPTPPAAGPDRLVPQNATPGPPVAGAPERTNVDRSARGRRAAGSLPELAEGAAGSPEGQERRRSHRGRADQPQEQAGPGADPVVQRDPEQQDEQEGQRPQRHRGHL